MNMLSSRTLDKIIYTSDEERIYQNNFEKLKEIQKNYQ